MTELCSVTVKIRKPWWESVTSEEWKAMTESQQLLLAASFPELVWVLRGGNPFSWPGKWRIKNYTVGDSVTSTLTMS